MPAGAPDRPPRHGRPASPQPPAGEPGSAPRLLLGQLVAARDRSVRGDPDLAPLEPLPPIQPAPVPDGPGALRGRAARRRRADLEESARRNARLVSTARDLLVAERRRLEVERSARHDAEREMAALQRALDGLRAAAARRAAPASSSDPPRTPGTAEVGRLQRALDDQAALTTEYAERLRGERRVREATREALRRADAARRRAERRLEQAAAVIRGRAESELAEIAAAEEAARRAGEERDALAARLAVLTDDEHLRALEARNAALEVRVEELEAAVAAAVEDRDAADARAAILEAARGGHPGRRG